VKITKKQLKQIIKEELQKVLSEQDLMMGRRRKKLRPKDFEGLIAAATKVWAPKTESYELKEYTLSIWADVMNNVITAWDYQKNEVHGCRMHAESSECQTIAAVLSQFHRHINPLVEEGASLVGRNAAIFIANNSRMLRKSMDYVPIGKAPNDFINSKVWQENLGAYSDPDDDL